MVEKIPKWDKDKIDKFAKEFKKYMEEKKEKKNYSVYLTKEDVEFVKKKFKTSLSKYLDDMVRIMALTLKKAEKEMKKRNKK